MGMFGVAWNAKLHIDFEIETTSYQIQSFMIVFVDKIFLQLAYQHNVWVKAIQIFFPCIDRFFESKA